MRAYLKEGLEKNPDHVALILSLAQLEANEKNFDAVEVNLQKAIALKPDVILYKLNLAKVLMAQGKRFVKLTTWF